MVITSDARHGPTRRARLSPQAVVRILIALVALFMLVVSHAASASVADERAVPSRVTFGVQPATSHALDQRSYFSYGTTPGATVTDHAAIVNYSTRPLRLTVYATDAITTDGGGFGLLPARQKATDAGSWITLGSPAPRVTVPARSATGPGSVILPVSVTVPLGATPGDHVAGIIASLSTVSSSPGQANVKLQQRVASRVYIRVAGTLDPQLTVSDVHASYRGGLLPIGTATTVDYTVTNTGNVKLGGVPAVTVSSLFGPSVRAKDGVSIPLLLPGGAIRLRAVVSGVLPLGLMTAHVVVSPVSVTGDADPAVPVANGSVRFWAIPWLLVLVVVVAIAGGIWQYRRRRSSGAPTTDDQVRVPERVKA